MVDLASVGAAHRAEAEKALHRAIAFGVILVLAHLLDIRPSEVEGAGIKFSLKDPVVVYGAIALVFGYYLSRSVNESERGAALLWLQLKPRRIRANLRIARMSHRATKEGRQKPQTPRQLKLSAQRFMLFSDVLLIPYRVISSLFVIAALAFAVTDLIGLTKLIWATSPIISEISNAVAP